MDPHPVSMHDEIDSTILDVSKMKEFKILISWWKRSSLIKSEPQIHALCFVSIPLKFI